jgi:A/G-specific adenine glycosylase
MPRRLLPDAVTVNAFRRGLLLWYARRRRALPWRRTRDPYRIWVSEIMLQQTRVATVIPYYRRWIRQFPTVQALARASQARVLKWWEGLGYYARARHLHRAAKQVAREGLPATAAQWQTLPGVGPYTAAAIASMAFGEAVPVVDGNVARVLARVFGIRQNVRRPATLRRLRSLAADLIPATRPGDFNQALMELGALVCRPVGPRCGECPLRRVCRAPGDGLPNRGRRPGIQPVVITAAAVWRGRRLLVRQRPARGSLGGLWELPVVAGGRELFRIRYPIMNQRVTLRVVSGPVVRRGRWIRRSDLARLAFPAGQRRAIERLFSAQDQDRALGFVQEFLNDVAEKGRG